jgi:hypothetical protein
MFISIVCHPPSDTGDTSAYTLTVLELFLLHKEFIHWTLQANVTNSHTFYGTLQKHSLRGTCTKLAFTTNSNYLIALITDHVHLYLAVICITEPWL